MLVEQLFPIVSVFSGRDVDWDLCFCLAFEPVRMSIQGDVIRDLDMSNTQNRKSEHPDSDDEEQQGHGTSNGRSATNIYIERQKKRVKLANSSDFI